MGKATIIKVDGTEQELGHRPGLKEAQRIVGGYITLLPLRKTRLTLVLNEEGKIRGLPMNTKASILFKPWELVGNIIVLDGWKTVGA